MPAGDRSYEVRFIEAIGGHRGMHYYDLGLCTALTEQGVDVTLFTCDETQVPEANPFPVKLAFRNVFGDTPAWLRGLRYALGLSRAAEGHRKGMPSVVHVHFFHVPPLDWAFLRWMRSRGCRIVVTAHDVAPFDAGPLRLVLVRQMYRLAHRIIVHTHSSRDELLAGGKIPSERVAVIPHGNYMPFAEKTPSVRESRERLTLPLDAPIILFFGQIKEVKGLDVLLQAIAVLHREYPEAQLVIAGKVWKDDWSRYQSLIEDLGIGPHVSCHLRHIPDAEVPHYFRAADLVALPYRHVYQSGVLLMALSYGKPVVATRLGGLAEVLEDGHTGYLVPPDDPQSLAVAIKRILDEPERAKAAGRRGQEIVQAHYSWDRVASLTRQTYEQALLGG